jgi:hypothetical protein
VRRVAELGSLACIVRLVYSIALCLLMVGCGSECDIINVRDYPSPDGQRVATVYGYICYNTTGYDKYVDLHRARKKMRHPGNVTAVGPGEAVSVAWASPTELVVSYCYEVSRPGPATTNIDGVTITFKDTPELRGTQQ